MLKRMLTWLWRAWPSIIIATILVVQLLFVHFLSLDTVKTNKFMSLVLQITGGLIVLYSIDSNIGIIEKKSLGTVFLEYLRDFPLRKRSYVLNVEPGKINMTISNARITVERNPKTIEEEISYLKEQIAEIDNYFKSEIKRLEKNHSQLLNDIGDWKAEINKELKEIDVKVKEITVGGIKWQIFGVLLIIYGAIAGYFA